MTRTLFFLSALSTLVACGENLDEAPEIEGTYVDDFGSDHAITADTWTMYGTTVLNFVEVHNSADFLIAQNDAANEFNPSLYSRVDWFDDGTDLWFCQSAFDAATIEDATAASASTSELDSDGCGGFPWSKLLTP